MQVAIDMSAVAGWSDFLVAAAGAAAALVGLVFVAISINLAQIIALPGVSGRAAETLILLSGTLAGTLVMLIPHQSVAHLAIALSCVTIPTWAVPIMIQVRAIRNRAYYRAPQVFLRLALHQLAALPGVLAGLALYGVLPGGIAWLAAGAIMSMLVAMLSAWVLLIEIQR